MRFQGWCIGQLLLSRLARILLYLRLVWSLCWSSSFCPLLGGSCLFVQQPCHIEQKTTDMAAKKREAGLEQNEEICSPQTKKERMMAAPADDVGVGVHRGRPPLLEVPTSIHKPIYHRPRV